MPITRIDAQPLPYVRPAYEPDTRTLRELMAMAGAANAASVGRRAQARAAGVMTLGELVRDGIQSYQDGRDRKAALQAAALKQKFDDDERKAVVDLRERAQGLDERKFEDERSRRLVDRNVALDAASVMRIPGLSAQQRAQELTESALRNPESPSARFMLDTADRLSKPPELISYTYTHPETGRQSLRFADKDQVPETGLDLGGKPDSPSNPTEWSVLMDAAGGDPRKALELRRQQQKQAETGARPLTQTAEAQIIQRLANQWSTANKPMKELDRQVALMEAGLTAARRGDRAQGDQALLVTFQKILDPPSVVRESEYMRSASGQSLIDQWKGYADKLIQGGSGLTIDQLDKFAQVAREAAVVQRRAAGLEGLQSRLRKTADRYNIPQELVFDAVSDATVDIVDSSAVDREIQSIREQRRKGGGR